MIKQSLACAVLLASSASLAAPQWRVQLDDEVAGLKAADARATVALDELRGLDPNFYTQQRRPEPEVGRDLMRMVEDGFPAALLMDRALHLDTHRFSHEGDFSPRFQAAAKKLIAEERAQLEDGILYAVARSGHPLADAFLVDEYVLRVRSERSHRLALEVLGHTRTQLAEDTLVARGHSSAAIMGIANLAPDRARAILIPLQAQVKGSASEVRQATAHALARVGDSREVVVALVNQLRSEEDSVVQNAIGEALVRISHPETAQLLQGARLSGEGRVVAERTARIVARRLARRR